MIQEGLFEVSVGRFDLPKGEALKQRGMEVAASTRIEDLELARQELRIIAQGRPDRCVTADDAARFNLGNSAGSLFRGGEWEFTGRWEKSKRPARHANNLRVWRMR